MKRKSEFIDLEDDTGSKSKNFEDLEKNAFVDKWSKKLVRKNKSFFLTCSIKKKKYADLDPLGRNEYIQDEVIEIFFKDIALSVELQLTLQTNELRKTQKKWNQTQPSVNELVSNWMDAFVSFFIDIFFKFSP